MGEIWTDQNKYATWLKVELVACEAMAKIGKIPPKALKNIKKKAGFSVARKQYGTCKSGQNFT